MNVYFKDQTIVVGSVFHDEETKWTSMIEVTAKVNATKDAFEIGVKIKGEAIPDETDTKFNFLGAVCEAILQADYQARQQLEKPAQLNLFYFDGVGNSIADRVRRIMTDGVEIKMERVG